MGRRRDPPSECAAARAVYGGYIYSQRVRPKMSPKLSDVAEDVQRLKRLSRESFRELLDVRRRHAPRPAVLSLCLT